MDSLRNFTLYLFLFGMPILCLAMTPSLNNASGPAINKCGCSQHGICNPFSSKCGCHPGFHGERCEFVNACHEKNNLCPNNKTCVPINDTFNCTCPKGYEGRDCEIKNPCLLKDTCLNNGTCTRISSNTFRCKCTEYFLGENCQLPNYCSSSPCGIREKCVYGDNTYHCKCLEGYSGQGCKDRNPCILDKIVCKTGEFCHRVNNENGICKVIPNCRPKPIPPPPLPLIKKKAKGKGLIDFFTKPTKKEDECPCCNGGTCNMKKNINRASPNCTCPKGFHGEYCEFIDECYKNKPCRNNGSCTVVESSYNCSCPLGYEGSQCESKNPCIFNNTCSNNGTCTRVSNEEFKCNCLEGFSGQDCQERNPCILDKISCKPSESCHRIDNKTGVCREGTMCREGLYGDNCEFIDGCYKNKFCENGGTCVRVKDMYNCSCAIPYEGVVCEIRNPCLLLENTCVNSGICSRVSDTKYNCTCSKYFFGEQCQYQNYCLSAPCRENQKCINGEYSHHCECFEGFSGKNCHKRNPCILDKIICKTGEFCHRINNETAVCKAIPNCKAPLPNPKEKKSKGVFDPFAIKREKENECPCCNGGTCYLKKNINRASPNCTCPDGFHGEYCEFVDECYKNKPCQNNGTCTVEENWYNCSCLMGYEGLQCESKNPCILNNTCLNNGTCSKISNEELNCTCTSEYSGNRCQFKNSCISSPCLGRGHCVPTAETYECKCFKGYNETNCQNRDPCILDKIVCNVGETCQRINNETGICTCKDDNCRMSNSNTINSCTMNSPCKNGGKCEIDHEQIAYLSHRVKCICRHGYDGEFCERADPCKLNPKFCGHHETRGKCERVNDTAAKCECFKGFNGDNCEFEDSCTPNPCLNGGECRAERHSYECSCPKFYYGKNCSIHFPPRNTLPDYIIPNSTFVGEKFYMNASLPANMNNKTYLEWNFGDGTLAILTADDIGVINRRYFPEPTYLKPKYVYDMSHTYNKTGEFSITIYSVDGYDPKMRKFLYESKIRVGNRVNVTTVNPPSESNVTVAVVQPKCTRRVWIHNVGHKGETKPPPVYTRRQTIFAWSVIYQDCNRTTYFNLSNTIDRSKTHFIWHLAKETKKGRQMFMEPIGIKKSFVKKNSIQFEPGSLEHGNYHLQVADSSDPLLNNSGMFFVKPSKPWAIILGRRLRVVGPNELITLDGSTSFDPDFSNSELKFKWYCFNNKNPGTSKCGLSGNWNGSKVNVDTKKLPTGLNNTFTLVVESNRGKKEVPSKARATQIIFVDTKAPNSYSITCIENCGKNVLVDKKIILKCSCEKCKKRSNHWDIQFGPQLKTIHKSFTSNDSHFEEIIQIEKNSLTTQTNFSVTCGDKDSQAVYHLVVNNRSESDGLSGATCTKTPCGTGLETKFIVNCISLWLYKKYIGVGNF